MDGFTSIPIQNAGATSGNISAMQNIPTSFDSTPYKDNAVGGDDGIEIVDDSSKKKEENSFGFLLPLSILALFVSFGYFGYLVFNRFVTIDKIALLSEQFQVLSGNINKNEIEEFIALDNSLKAVKQKIGTHTQLGGVLAFVNKNIRNNVQISDYRIESRENEVVVGLSSMAPTFREFAEQTEKMAELKTAGAIKDFNVTQMALESDGRRVRYVLNLTFDKTKISVAALAAQNAVQVTNNPEAN